MGTRAQGPVLPLTRAVALGLVPILLATAIGLYGWPGATGTTFAWTVVPDLTALLMGAGYASGVVFFLLAATRGRRWLEVSFGFVGISVFTVLMGVATIVHWDRFDHGHPSFWAWVALYAVTPVIVPALWVYNGGWRPPRAGEAEAMVPRWARLALALVGLVALGVGLLIFVAPSVAAEHWPWDVTPLTARVVGAFTALNVGWAAASLDGRWTALRIPGLSSLSGFVLLLLAFARARGDLHTDGPATWIYAGAVAAITLLLGWLLTRAALAAYGATQTPARSSSPSSP